MVCRETTVEPGGTRPGATSPPAFATTSPVSHTVNGPDAAASAGAAPATGAGRSNRRSAYIRDARAVTSRTSIPIRVGLSTFPGGSCTTSVTPPSARTGAPPPLRRTWRAASTSNPWGQARSHAPASVGESVKSTSTRCSLTVSPCASPPPRSAVTTGSSSAPGRSVTLGGAATEKAPQSALRMDVAKWRSPPPASTSCTAAAAASTSSSNTGSALGRTRGRTPARTSRSSASGAGPASWRLRSTIATRTKSRIGKVTPVGHAVTRAA